MYQIVTPILILSVLLRIVLDFMPTFDIPRSQTLTDQVFYRVTHMDP